MKTPVVLISLLSLVISSSTFAQVTYVDASEGGNTFIAPSAGGGTPFTVAPFGTQGPANDGLWDARAFGNSATIYQNAGVGAGVDVEAVRLETRVSGLPLDSYNVYLYFWSDSSLNWRIGAGLGDIDGQLPLSMPGGPGVTQFYVGTDATVFSTALAENPFTGSVMVAEGNRRLYQVPLGTVTGTSFSVFVEGDRSMTGQDQRTWYDGIGYSIVPEPSVAALAGFISAALLVLRPRRK